MRRLFGFSKKSQKVDGGESSSPAASAGDSRTGEALPSPQMGGPLSFSNPLDSPQESFRELGTHQQPHVNQEQQQGSNNSKKSQGQQRQVAFAGATTTDTESSHPLRPGKHVFLSALPLSEPGGLSINMRRGHLLAALFSFGQPIRLTPTIHILMLVLRLLLHLGLAQGQDRVKPACLLRCPRAEWSMTFISRVTAFAHFLPESSC